VSSMESVILGIINNVEYGRQMPKKLMEDAHQTEARIYDKSARDKFHDALERALTSYSASELFEIALSHTAPEKGAPTMFVSQDGFKAMVHDHMAHRAHTFVH
jgi:hypothetical protein